MTQKPSNELVGIAIYKEHKQFGENYMELLHICVKTLECALGIRFMSQILYWASKKKRYSEMFVMADINAVSWFMKNEFVLMKFNELSEKIKKNL